MSKKYLYLEKKEWVTTWVNGGEVPLKPASEYLNDKREGVFTPDECTKRNLSGISEPDFKRIISVDPNTEIQVVNCYANVADRAAWHKIQFIQKKWNGIIFSVSNEFDPEIANGLKKKACVEILDIEELKNILDKQLGVISEARDCTYTASNNRSPFLKSEKDAWQKEFRFFWRILHPEIKYVNIPKGIALEIPMI